MKDRDTYGVKSYTVYLPQCIILYKTLTEESKWYYKISKYV